MVRTKQNLSFLKRWTHYEIGKSMKKIIKEGNYKGFSVISEEQLLKQWKRCFQNRNKHMNYIVFDLEWNQPYSNDISFMKRTKMPLTGEIIQIGAVKLNEKMDIVDHFTMFIKPQYLPRMHKHVRELTGILHHENSIMVCPFKTAMQHFQNWCGYEYMLLSWGSDDILILRENLMLHRMKALSYDQWVDAQMIYSLSTIWYKSTVFCSSCHGGLKYIYGAFICS